MMELVPFATDEFKEGFVIFKIDNGEDLNAYVWVDDRGVRITDIYGLASYCNHAVSPLFVGEIPDEMVEKAKESLSALDAEKRKKLIDGFNEKIDRLKENEERYKEREEYEDGVIKDIEEGNNVKDGLFWLM